MNDSSKVALVALVEFSLHYDIKMIDCQMTTSHLLSLGAREVERSVFIKKLNKFLKKPTLIGNWNTNYLSVKSNFF